MIKKKCTRNHEDKLLLYNIMNIKTNRQRRNNSILFKLIIILEPYGVYNKKLLYVILWSIRRGDCVVLAVMINEIKLYMMITCSTN